MLGIYMIHNVVSNKVYIGQTVNINHRFVQHSGELRRGVHENTALQCDYDNYGKQSLRYVVLEMIDKNKDGILDEREIYWINFYKNLSDYDVYNLTNGGLSGYKRSEETKKKISLSKTGSYLSDETKEKIRQANIGDKNPKYWLGKHRSEKQKQKQSEAMKGKMSGENHPMYGKEGYWKDKKHPKEFGKQISQTLMGHKVSDESKKKMSDAKKGKEPCNKFPLTPELLEDMQSGINRQAFVEKYRMSVNTFYRIKKELKTKSQ
jgi:group I intron endonuclease